MSDGIARQGDTPLAVAGGMRLLGVVQLNDIVKAGIRERFGELRRMGTARRDRDGHHRGVHRDQAD